MMGGNIIVSWKDTIKNAKTKIKKKYNEGRKKYISVRICQVWGVC